MLEQFKILDPRECACKDSQPEPNQIWNLESENIKIRKKNYIFLPLNCYLFCTDF